MVFSTTAFSSDLSVEEVSKLLRASENGRSSFRVSFQRNISYFDDNGTPAKTVMSGQHWTDGHGRLGVRRFLGENGQTQELGVWNGKERRAFQSPDKDGTKPGVFSVSENTPSFGVTDEVENSWALKLPGIVSDKMPSMRPSKAILEWSDRTTILQIEKNGHSFVHVIIEKPHDIQSSELHYYFDPAKDWIPVRIENDLFDPDDNKHQIISRAVWETQESEQIGGTYIPTQVHRTVDNYGIIREDTLIVFSDIDLEPAFNEKDFTIPISTLPKGTSIADHRLKISYKLGQNLIYMNGHLNEVKQPIDHEIKPGELKNIMKDAIVFIDPVATANEAKLKTVTPKGKYAFLTHWGFILLGLAFASMGIILWRRNHA